MDGEVFSHDLTPFASAQEAVTGVAVLPVSVIGPLELELGEYELEEPFGRLVETGRSSDRVYVPLGHTEGGLSASLYRGARVFALPSVHVTCYGREIRVSELLGLSCIEAMASGTPVVASNIGGLRELVEDGVTGFLVEPGNVAELRERLAEVLGDRRLAERLGRSARERFLDRFTWEACAERCLAAYSELVSTGPR